MIYANLAISFYVIYYLLFGFNDVTRAPTKFATFESR